MYLGVDIHKAFCQTTVMDESGTIVERAKVPTDREHLSEFFRRYSGSRAVIESNTVWKFVYDELRSLRIDTILANPLQVRAIAKSKKKTDRVDSATLAHLLRANLIPEAWAGPKATRDLRDIRSRMEALEHDLKLLLRRPGLVGRHPPTPRRSGVVRPLGASVSPQTPLSYPGRSNPRSCTNLLGCGTAGPAFLGVPGGVDSVGSLPNLPSHP
ncbi:MAG: transposase [Thermoplasmatales archaeon]|nr:transposase [Thermoplasmatales archaeon]